MANNISNKEFYIIGYNGNGEKIAHFMGYPYENDEGYKSVEYTGVEVYVEQVRSYYNDGTIQDYADANTQYIVDHESEEDQRKYWIGDEFFGQLELSEVDCNTPLGVYCCTSLKKC